MKKFNILSSFFLSIIFSLNVSAATWDGTESGQVHSVNVASGENYGFRVTLSGAPKLCGNAHSWAYLNESQSNYQTFVSVLLAAKMSDKRVTLYTTKETTSGNEYCRIGYVDLR